MKYGGAENPLKSRLKLYSNMESSMTYAQRIIEKEIAAKTMSPGIVCTYTDTGYNNCDGKYYDTND